MRHRRLHSLSSKQRSSWYERNRSIAFVRKRFEMCVRVCMFVQTPAVRSSCRMRSAEQMRQRSLPICAPSIREAPCRTAARRRRFHDRFSLSTLVFLCVCVCVCSRERLIELMSLFLHSFVGGGGTVAKPVETSVGTYGTVPDAPPSATMQSSAPVPLAQPVIGSRKQLLLVMTNTTRCVQKNQIACPQCGKEYHFQSGMRRLCRRERDRIHFLHLY
jgi:hypothetical protein